MVEQIDGLIEVDGQLYLVELKWWITPLGTPEGSPPLVRVFGHGRQERELFISYTEFANAR